MSLWGPNSNSVPMLPWPKVHPWACLMWQMTCLHKQDCRWCRALGLLLPFSWWIADILPLPWLHRAWHRPSYRRWRGGQTTDFAVLAWVSWSESRVWRDWCIQRLWPIRCWMIISICSASDCRRWYLPMEGKNYTRVGFRPSCEGVDAQVLSTLIIYRRRRLQDLSS